MTRKKFEFYTDYEQLPLILTVNDLIVLLGISRVNAYSLVHKKGFPKIVLNRRILIPKEKLLEWIRSQAIDLTND